MKMFSQKDAAELKAGDVLLFFEREGVEVYGQKHLVWKAKVFICQAVENGYIFLVSADLRENISGKISFFEGRAFTKLGKNQHPEVINEGMNYVFKED